MKKIILLLTANPSETDRLSLDEEARAVIGQLQLSRNRDEFEVRRETAVRVEDLRRAMFYNQPDIVHFSGHGLREGLILEDDNGESQIVPTKALSDFFRLFANKVECVLLNACFSESQAKAVGRHIKYVIGMRKEIGDEAAILFTKGFYEGLGGGLSVEDAFKSGQNSIQMRNIPENTTPVLHINLDTQAETKIANAADANLRIFPTGAPVKVFFSYAPEDDKLRQKIDTSLIALQRRKLIESWSKRQIPPGEDWSKQIDSHFEEAQIILLLVSDNFIASTYCYDVEMERAMERQAKGEVRVIPILLRQCLWEELPFAKLSPLPSNREPICSWKPRDDGFYEVAKGIESVIKNFK